jgi:hypothetical protein
MLDMPQVVLEWPLEHIVRVEGTFGFVGGYEIITSVTFISNKAVYGPYGAVEGERFTSRGPGNVVGFFGRAGSYVDQLGVFTSSTETVSAGVEGSWGGDGGYAFSDGRGEIVEITINYNSDQIVSLQATYDHHGHRFPGAVHGGEGGECEKVQRSRAQIQAADYCGSNSEAWL